MHFTSWTLSSEKQWNNGHRLPHGVLFRGAAEGKIREKLLRSGNIYAVIGLPANLFIIRLFLHALLYLKSIEMAEMYCY